jgi:hypothetical protein
MWAHRRFLGLRAGALVGMGSLIACSAPSTSDDGDATTGGGQGTRASAQSAGGADNTGGTASGGRVGGVSDGGANDTGAPMSAGGIANGGSLNGAGGTADTGGNGTGGDAAAGADNMGGSPGNGAPGIGCGEETCVSQMDVCVATVLFAEQLVSCEPANEPGCSGGCLVASCDDHEDCGPGQFCSYQLGENDYLRCAMALGHGALCSDSSDCPDEFPSCTDLYTDEEVLEALGWQPRFCTTT